MEIHKDILRKSLRKIAILLEKWENEKPPKYSIGQEVTITEFWKATPLR